MRNRTYGGVRGRKTKVGEKLLRFPPTRLVPIHRHEETAETVLCLCGKLDVVLYEEIVGYESAAPHGLPQGMDAQDIVRRVDYREVRRIRLCPAEARYGCQIPKGVWHSVDVIDPCVVFEGNW